MTAAEANELAACVEQLGRLEAWLEQLMEAAERGEPVASRAYALRQKIGMLTTRLQPTERRERNK